MLPALSDLACLPRLACAVMQDQCACCGLLSRASFVQGAAADAQEAQELGKALCSTGVVLRFCSNVFVWTEEVIQPVLQVSAACDRYYEVAAG